MGISEIELTTTAAAAAGEHAVNIPYLKEVALVLGAAALMIPLCHRLRISPIFGFLAAGALIGPYGFRATDNVEGVRVLADFGVVFLLFMIGLELSFERLKDMRRMVFGLGGAQVVLSAIAIGFFAYWFGNNVAASIIIGCALALSSTAIVVQLLIERGEMAQRHGRSSFAVLLFQDLAVVPILMLVGVLAQDDTTTLASDLSLAALKAVAAVIGIILVGRIVLRRLYRLVAAARSREALLAMSLLVILATAWLTGQAGLSMALGAFLAGLVLAETEYRHQIESDIEPFRAILLGLFFISVGMNLNFGEVAAQWDWLALSVLGLIVTKAVILSGLCLLFKIPLDVSVRTGLMLSAGGEFAFVILALAMNSGTLLPSETGQFMVIVATISMTLTPLLAALGRHAAKWLAARTRTTDPDPTTMGELDGHVVIAGFGRVGQTVARLLDRHKIGYVALDMNAFRIKQYRDEGKPVYYGDATRQTVLDKVHPERAAAILITLDNPDAARQAVRAARAAAEGVPIIARAADTAHADELTALGANTVVPELLEASLQLGGTVLQLMGTGREAVDALLDRIREEAYEPIAGDKESGS